MFLSIGAMGNFLGKFHASPTHGAASGRFNDGVKNGRCTCPDVAGIQLELEEQARLLELLLDRPVELGSRTAAGCF